MTITGSGQIGMSDIATEIGIGNSNLSLTTLSVDDLGGSAPHAMSEWYGWSSETTTIFPAATFVGGYVYQENGSWSVVHGASTGKGIDHAYGLCRIQGMAGGEFQIVRTSCAFDTGALPNGATIISAKIVINPHSGLAWDFGSSATVGCVQYTGATTLGTADYNNFGTSLYSSDLTISSLSSPIEFPLNIPGRAAISKTGWTLIGMRVNRDRNNSQPSWAEGSKDHLVFLMSNCDLSVTYS